MLVAIFDSLSLIVAAKSIEETMSDEDVDCAWKDGLQTLNSNVKFDWTISRIKLRPKIKHLSYVPYSG